MNKTFGKVVAVKVFDSVSTTSDSLQVQQTVTTVYPSARGANSLSSALVADSEFGEGATFESTRNAFIKIPKGMNLVKAKALLAKIPNGGHIYRIMSTNVEDVATVEQLSMIATSDLEEKLTAINPETGDTMLFNGKPFFRATYWKDSFTEDIDLRSVKAVQPAKVVSETEDIKG